VYENRQTWDAPTSTDLDIFNQNHGILHQALKVVNTYISGSQAPAWEFRVWKLQLPVTATKLELRRVGSQAGAWEPVKLESVKWNMKDADILFKISGVRD